MAKRMVCVACNAFLEMNVAECQCRMCLPEEAAYHAAGWMSWKSKRYCADCIQSSGWKDRSDAKAETHFSKKHIEDFCPALMLSVNVTDRRRAGATAIGLEQPPPVPQTVQPPPPPGILQSPLPPPPESVVPAGYVSCDVVKNFLDQLSTLQMRVADLEKEKVSCGSSTASWSVEDGVTESHLEAATMIRSVSADSFTMVIPAKKEEEGISKNLDMVPQW